MQIDVWALVLPRQGELQCRRNVHFMPTGSTVLAQQGAGLITAELAKPVSR